MTDQNIAERQLWCEVVLRAYRDVEALEELAVTPRDQQRPWQIKRIQEINLAGDPYAWLQSGRCEEILSMLEIRR